MKILAILNNCVLFKIGHFNITIEHFSLLIVFIRRLKVKYVTANSSY